MLTIITYNLITYLRQYFLIVDDENNNNNDKPFRIHAF